MAEQTGAYKRIKRLISDENTTNVDSKYDHAITESDTGKITHETRIELGLRLKISQLIRVDTSSQTFGAVCLLDKVWKATDNDIKHFNENKGEYAPEIIPQIDLKNNIDFSSMMFHTFRSGSQFFIRKGNNNMQYNVQRLFITGNFTEPFEVENFPFDVQDLTFIIASSELSVKQFKFVPVPFKKDYICVDKTWNSATEWDIVSCDAVTTIIDELKARSGGEMIGGERDHYPYIQFRIQVVRKWRAVFLSTVLWMFLLNILSLCIFAYPPTNIEGRLGFAITLVLTIVAFQFVISSQLPNVSYLTIIDKYNIYTLIFILILSFESVITGYNEEGLFSVDPHEIDKIFGISLAILWFICHILFIIYSRVKYKKERLKIDDFESLDVKMVAKFVSSLDNPNEFKKLPK